MTAFSNFCDSGPLMPSPDNPNSRQIEPFWIPLKGSSYWESIVYQKRYLKIINSNIERYLLLTAYSSYPLYALVHFSTL